MQNILTRLRQKSKMAYGAFWILAALYALAALAGVIAPHPYDRQFREYSLCPPTPLHFVDRQGKFHLRPFVYGLRLTDPGLGRYETDYSRMYPVPDKDGPFFPFGTDQQGRDVFSRVMHGARISLSIGLIGVLISFVLGLLIGGISGYIGGRTDAVLMRTVEVVMVFPAFYLLLALRATFPTNVSSVHLYFLIVAILSLIGWAGLARIIRGMVLSLKEEEYILAGRALGLSTFRIITRHILPNTFSYTITALTLSIPGYILGESALSLLGLGIQEPYPSWGNMLSVSVGNLKILTYAPWMLLPGFFIFLTVICFNFLGDGLRDALDPKNW